MKKRLEELGFEVKDSSANFLFASPSGVSAQEIFEELRNKDIYVRYFNKPRINNYLRITIGTKEEMERLFEFLHSYLQ